MKSKFIALTLYPCTLWIDFIFLYRVKKLKIRYEVKRSNVKVKIEKIMRDKEK